MGTGRSWLHAVVRDSDGKRRRWAAPIPWFAGIAGVAALGIGGLFGGLAPVDDVLVTGDETTVVDAGVVTIGVEKALIVDDAGELNIDLDRDEDLLLMRVVVTNTYNEPIHGTRIFAQTFEADPLSIVDEGGASSIQVLRIPDIAAQPSLLMRLDTSEMPAIVLQPGVPTKLAIGFVIPADTDLSELSIRVDKITTFQFTFLGDGEDHGFNSEGHFATLTVPVTREVIP